MTTLLALMLRTSLILVVGLVASLVLRRRSAAVRHWVLAMSIACAALAPILGRAMPVWTVPALTRATPSTSHVEVSVRSAAVPDAPALGSIARPPQTTAFVQRLGTLIVPVWIAGALIKMVVLIIGMSRLARLTSISTPCCAVPMRQVLRRLSSVFGVRRAIDLRRTDRPAVVMTWGVLSPTVILPTDADSWPPQRTEVVLAHEVAHVVRGDWLVQIVAELSKAVYWFNPLFWIAVARLRYESERACDDAVVSVGIDGRVYASELLAVARSCGRHQQRWLPAPAMAAHPSNLERRVRAMLTTGIDRTPITGRGRSIAALALVALTLPIVSFAQSTFATFSGVVLDQQDRVLPNATVTLNDAVRNVKHETKADANGRFEFVGLPPGDYTYIAKQLGFRDLAGSLPLSGQPVSRALKMDVGTLQETVFVASSDGAITNARQTGTVAAKRPIDGCAATASGAGGNIRPPHKVKDVRPGYPGADGRVELAATIGTDGSVVDVQVVTADRPELVPAATDAVRQWEFDSTLLNCVPIEVQMNVSVTFGKQ